MSGHRPPCVMTIDLEDWFHCLEPDPSRWGRFPRRIEVGTERLLETLEHCRAKATFFVLGDVAEQSPQLISRIAQQGHEIGTHGMAHRFVYHQTQEEFRADLKQSIDLLQSITGTKICSYRAPYFSITSDSLWALDILEEQGILHDSSIFPVRNHRYGIPGARRTPHRIGARLWEWPVSVLRTPLGNLPFAGGVYFRFLPWPLVRAAVQTIKKRNEPILIYLHPWELDPQQPRVRVGSRFLRLRHYYGLKTTRPKLEKLLSLARFVTMAEGVQMLQPTCDP